MYPGDVGEIAERCFAPDKAGKFRLSKSGQDRGKPRRRLGMAAAGIVTDAVRMCHKQCRHGMNLSQAR